MQLQSKKDIFNNLIQKGSVFIHFNGTKTKWIPFDLQSKEHVVFQFGLDLPIHIPDIRATDYSLSGTLSFKGKPFLCEIPWNAVYAIICKDSDGYSLSEYVYEKEIPLRVRNGVDESDYNSQHNKNVNKTNNNSLNKKPTALNKKRPPYLRLVK